MSLFTLGGDTKKTILPVPRTDGPAIDPATGRPYNFSTNGSGGENVWTLNGTNLSGANAQGLGGYSGVDSGGPNVSNITPMGLNQQDWLRSVGYQPTQGDPYGGTQAYNPNTGSVDSTGKVEQYLQSQGITLAEKSGESNGQNRVFQAFKNGQPIGNSFKVKDNEDAFGVMVAAAAAIATAGVATAGVAGAEGGAAAVDGAGGMGLAEGATPASLTGGEAGGGAIGGGAGGAAGANGMVLNPADYSWAGQGATTFPADTGALGNTAWTTVPDAAAPGSGLTAGQVGSGVAGAGGAGGGLGSSATNSTLADSYAGTPGYGASSASGSVPGQVPVGGGGVGDLTGINGPTAGSGATDWSKLTQAQQIAKLMSGGVGSALAGAGAALANGGGGSIGIPNYQGAATSQGLSGRTDQTNPYGSLKYTQTGVDAQGNPIYKQDVSLNPTGAANFASAQGAQGTALGNWNDVLKNAGVDWGNIPGVYGDAGSQAALAKQAQDAMYDQQTRYLDPQYKQQLDSLTSNLANQGITMGSQAYQTAMDNFARQRDSAYGNARDSAINLGTTYGNTLFNQGLQAHQTGVNDWTTHLGTTGNAATSATNTANSFNPTFAAPPAPTNYLGAAALQGQGNLNQYNATTGANNSFNNGLFNLGGSILSNPSWTSLIGSFFGGDNSTPKP